MRGKSITQRTCRSAKNIIEKHWQPYFRDKTLGDVSRADLRKLAISLRGKLAGKTINNVLSVGIKALRWAYREKMIPEDITLDLGGFSGGRRYYGEIDTFINALKAEGRAAASVRKDIAAVSALFTFLERRHEGIKNAVRGTKKRPAEEPKKPPKVPTESEVGIIIDNANPCLAAAIGVMAYRDLRCGALPGLSAWGGQFEQTILRKKSNTL